MVKRLQTFTGPKKYFYFFTSFTMIVYICEFYWTDIYFTSHDIRTGVFHTNWGVNRCLKTVDEFSQFQMSSLITHCSP